MSIGSSIITQLENYIEGRKIYKNTREILQYMSVSLGERNLNNLNNLNLARKYIFDYFNKFEHSSYEEEYTVNGKNVANIVSEIPGSIKKDSIIIIGAHYDTVEGSPGADDNASAIAGLLELYRLLSRHTHKRTLRFIAFTLEEPPFFSSNKMGSMHHAHGCKKRKEKIDLMICLEMIGYSGRKIVQNYPENLPGRDIMVNYTSRGDFLAVVSLPTSSKYAFLWKNVFNKYTRKKIFDFIGPASVPGISLSDHYSFNKYGYKSIMITDTGFYRNQHYHTENDSFKTINFRFLTKNIICSYNTIMEIANREDLVND